MADSPTPTATVADLRHGFDTRLTRPLAWRRAQLKQFKRMLEEQEAEWLAALGADLGKPATEAWAVEIAAVTAEIDHMLHHLGGWAAPRSVRVPLKLGVGKATVVPEPLGLVLVLAPWNYPINLLVLPMAFALAAGNCVVGKPSELAPATSAALARLVPKYLDERAVAIVEGAGDTATELLAERWDHIFYTGSGRVGRLVMEAAARHLTPVTLELGGKSPAVVDAEADLDVAARRIVWGKFVNAGQTCLAPDYVAVHRDVEEALLAKMVSVVDEFYRGDPRASPDYGRIINDDHTARLAGLLERARQGGGLRLVTGGQVEADQRYISPTILAGASWDDELMQEEIFGPILPVVAVTDVDAAIEAINARPKPLALYVFTSRPGMAERVIDRTSSGGVCVNGTLMQFADPDLPFGGVGPSGMGTYHGQFGFETFSHGKAVLDRATWFDPSFTYPPYTRLKNLILRRLL
ncbi:MAG: aldehyde dehydrogenase family protein [Actinomycetota bacterium]|nr:aldehyde dehydrogenase family protein [Actinomycetota bacterium]